MSSAENRIYFRLQLAAHRLQKRADRALIDAAGITTTQAAALVLIQRDGPATQRHIAAILGTNESALTTLASRLQQQGLIARQRDPADGRAWLLSVTEQGRAALAGAEKAFGPVNTALDEALCAFDTGRFAAALEAILAFA